MIICDVDEVVLAFAAGLDRHLAPHGLVLERATYALSGNIRHRDGAPLDPDRTRTLLAGFKRDAADGLAATPYAAEVLAGLSTVAEIRFLTNIDPDAAARRAAHLGRLGMPYPVHANAGPKGRAAAALAAAHRATCPGATVVFIDDSHANHGSVADETDDIVHIHFIADAGFRAVAPRVERAVLVTGDWRVVGTLIRGLLDRTDREGESA